MSAIGSQGAGADETLRASHGVRWTLFDVRLERRAVWRWHFYAGLLCIPLMLVLSVTGAIYLFRPQIEGWRERGYDTLVVGEARVSADAAVRSAQRAFPGATFVAYELPPSADAAARVLLRDGRETRRVYVHPGTGRVLGDIVDAARPTEVVKRIHGELLAGEAGSLVVELAACWGIVMILTGLWLWWPRGAAGAAGVLYPRLRAGLLYPRLRAGGRTRWRDLHAVVGFWVSAFALFLLVTGLPWAGVWGGALKQGRAIAAHLADEAAPGQDWALGSADEHALHRAHRLAPWQAQAGRTELDAMVRQAAALRLAPPVLVSPPSPEGAASSGGPMQAGSPGVWTVQSMSQDRTRREVYRFDRRTGAVVAHEGFGDRPLIDRAVGIGVAAHEGQLFGWPNQLLGLATALGLLTLSLSAGVLWWRRRPPGRLGAPPAPLDEVRVPWPALLALALLLPVLGASLMLLFALDRVAVRRVPALARWLGVMPRAA